jgi:hypothetical protein
VKFGVDVSCFVNRWSLPRHSIPPTPCGWSRSPNDLYQPIEVSVRLFQKKEICRSDFSPRTLIAIPLLQTLRVCPPNRQFLFLDLAIRNRHVTFVSKILKSHSHVGSSRQLH